MKNLSVVLILSAVISNGAMAQTITVPDDLKMVRIKASTFMTNDPCAKENGQGVLIVKTDIDSNKTMSSEIRYVCPALFATQAGATRTLLRSDKKINTTKNAQIIANTGEQTNEINIDRADCVNALNSNNGADQCGFVNTKDGTIPLPDEVKHISRINLKLNNEGNISISIVVNINDNPKEYFTVNKIAPKEESPITARNNQAHVW